MKFIAPAILSLAIFSSLAHAGEPLDAEAVKMLISGHTAVGVAPNGAEMKNFFAEDGKLFRNFEGQVTEGRWSVKENGAQCVEGVSGGCARIVRNDDGTYDRIVAGGKSRLKWTSLVKGRAF